MSGENRIHQRLASAVRDRDWIAVLIELLIVMVGVFLALEAANWNEARKERAQERRYYEQIVVDLRRDLESLKIAERRSRLNDRAAENVLAALNGKPPAGVSPGELAKDIHYAGFLYLPAPSRRTYDELISTGNLGLLRDSRAKEAIAAYYESFADSRQWDVLLRQQQANYWSTAAGILPRPVLQAAMTGSDVALSPAETEAILARLRSTSSIESLLIGMAAHQARVRRDSVDLEKEARALIADLEPLAR